MKEFVNMNKQYEDSKDDDLLKGSMDDYMLEKYF